MQVASKGTSHVCKPVWADYHEMTALQLDVLFGNCLFASDGFGAIKSLWVTCLELVNVVLKHTF